MALSTSPRPILPNVASTAEHTAARVRETVEEAEALERMGREALAKGADEHLDGFRRLERALAMRLRAAQIAEASVAAATPYDGDVLAGGSPMSPTSGAAVRKSCTAAAERVVVQYNEVAVRAFKKGDFEHASHLLSNAFRLCELSDEADVFGNDRLKTALKATTLNNFGCLERRRGRLAVALQYMRHSLDFASAQSPATLLNIAAVLTQMGHIDEAIGSARRAVGLLEQPGLSSSGSSVNGIGSQQDEGSPFGTHSTALRAVAHHNLAMSLERRDLAESLREYELALHLARQAGAMRTAQQIERGMARATELLGSPARPPSGRKLKPSDASPDKNGDSNIIGVVPSDGGDDHDDGHVINAIQKEALQSYRQSGNGNVVYDPSKRPPVPPVGHKFVPKPPPAARPVFDHSDVEPPPSQQPRKPTKPADAPPAKSGASSRPNGSQAVPAAGSAGGSQNPAVPESRRAQSSSSLREEESAVPQTQGAASSSGKGSMGTSKQSGRDTDAAETDNAAQAASSSGKPEQTSKTAADAKVDVVDGSAAPPSPGRPASGGLPPAHPTSTPRAAAGRGGGGNRGGGLASPVAAGARGITGRLQAREEEEQRKEEAVAFMHSRLLTLLRHEEEHEHRYIAARRIQCRVRCFLAVRSIGRRIRERKAMAKARLVRETNAAREVVRFFRVLRQRRVDKLEAQQAADEERRFHERQAVVIQCAARKYIARRFVRRVRRYKDSVSIATRVVQRATRLFLTKLRAERMRAAKAASTAQWLLAEKRTHAATQIQKVYRRHFTAIRLLLARGDVKAARERGWILGRTAASKKIQKLWRGYAVRKRFSQILKDANTRRRNREHAARRLNATILFQAMGRAQIVRAALKAPYAAHLITTRHERIARRHRCATIIQCLHRVAVARAELRRRRALKHRKRTEERKSGTLHMSVRGYEHTLSQSTE